MYSCDYHRDKNFFLLSSSVYINKGWLEFFLNMNISKKAKTSVYFRNGLIVKETYFNNISFVNSYIEFPETKQILE